MTGRPSARCERRRALGGLLAGFALFACRRPRTDSPSPSVQALLGAASDSHESSPEDVVWAMAELARIADLVRRTEGRSAAGGDRDASVIAALNGVVFGTLGFVREVEDTSLGFVLLPAVLRSRRGSCVGLGTLYLALGEMLSFPMKGVLRPGHFFVQAGDRARNIELLHRGEEMPTSWYATRFPIPDGGVGEYGRGLSISEVRGVVEFDVGNERRRQGRFTEARDAFARSARDFPVFSEALASLGAMQHLLGALDEAAANYAAAHRANPELEGLDRNIDLLERERAAKSLSHGGDDAR